MSIEPDPKARITIVLSGYEQRAESDRPTFHFCRLTGRQRRSLTTELMEAEEKTEAADPNDPKAAFDYLDACYQALGKLLVGWENQVDEQGKPLAFDANDLDRCVTDEELMELVVRLPREAMNTGADRKKSDSLSPSNTAPAAVAANPPAGA